MSIYREKTNPRSRRISRKIGGYSSSLSRRLKTQSKKEKDSKFVQICDLLLRDTLA
jgi:ribosomal protein S17E